MDGIITFFDFDYLCGYASTAGCWNVLHLGKFPYIDNIKGINPRGCCLFSYPKQSNTLK